MFKKVRLFFLLSLLAATSSYPQSRDKESLRGFHGVFLHVDPVGSDVEAANPIPAQTWTATAFGVTTPSRTDVVLESVKSKLSDSLVISRL